MPSYRCVILGCGPRAYWHARAYGRITRGELVACCDLDAERKERFAGGFDIKGYADAAQMVQAEKPDLVHIVTGPGARVELMQMVHDLGVPACLVEKPIATGVTDWKQLCELEATTRTRFAVNKQFRWHPNLTRCREALRSGRLGKLLLLDFSAGMNIAGQGTHIIDWAMSLNEDSPVVRVFGSVSGVDTGDRHHPAPDTTLAQVLFANGVYGLWNNGHTAPRVGDDTTTYQHCRVAAYAERGRTLYEEFGRWEIVSPDGVEGGRITDRETWTEGNHAAQANLTNAMFDWLEDDAKPAGTNLKLSLHQWNAALALYASAVYRKPIDLPFEPPDDLWQKLTEALASS